METLHSPGSESHSKMRVFSALRNPQFRRYWSGLLASVLGFHVMMVAQMWLIYELTESELYLGYAGLAAGLPAIVLNLFGGVLADKADKRVLLMITQGMSSLLMLILATLTLINAVQIWHILVIAFLTGSVHAFDNPARQALFPHLIERQDMMNAVALNSMVWQGTRVIGPALGGIIISTRLGVAPGFYASFLGFLIMAIVMFTLRLPPIPRKTGTTVAQDMAQGLNFVRSNSVFAILIGMTFFNSMFGMSYIFLLPVFAKDILQVGEAGFGYLHSVSGVGGILGTLLMAQIGNSPRKGWFILGGSILFGTFLILFAVSSAVVAWFPLALALIFLAGVSTSLYMVSIMTTLQTLVPDELRGRVMGIYMMTFSLLPLGAMQAGAVAEYTNASFAVALGGLAVVLFAGVMSIGSRQVRQLGSLVP